MFPNAFVVSLAGTPDRLHGFVERCKAAGVSGVRHFPAIRMHSSISSTMVHFTERKGALGCYMSHDAIIRTMAAQGAELVVIMEDDAMFCDNFVELFYKRLSELPEDWDVFFAGSIKMFNPVQVTGTIATADHSYGTHCYAIRGRSLPKIVKLLDSFAGPIDNLLTHRKFGLKCYYANPTLSLQKDGMSTIIDKPCNYTHEFKTPMMVSKIRVSRGCGILGDTIMVAHLVAIMRANGYDAYLADNPAFREILDVPSGEGGTEFKATYEGLAKSLNIIDGMLNKFQRQFGFPKLPITVPRPPIKFINDDSITGADVCLCTESGFYSKVRDWTNFDTLKELLDKNGVSWIDLNRLPKCDDPLRRAIIASNIIRKSKVYLGLETGASHLAAGILTPEQVGIIIQSGYSKPEYWTAQYPNLFRGIRVDMPCAGCFKRNVADCPHGHKCITTIHPDFVLHCIMKALKESQP